MKFCDSCGTILTSDFSQNNLKFVCNRCKKHFDSNDEDTLIFSINFKDDDSLKHITLLKSAYEDNTNTRVEKECPKCKEKIVKMVRIGEQLKPAYVCNCSHIF